MFELELAGKVRPPPGKNFVKVFSHKLVDFHPFVLASNPVHRKLREHCPKV
jgi:hypothetical protein